MSKIKEVFELIGERYLDVTHSKEDVELIEHRLKALNVNWSFRWLMANTWGGSGCSWVVCRVFHPYTESGHRGVVLSRIAGVINLASRGRRLRNRPSRYYPTLAKDNSLRNLASAEYGRGRQYSICYSMVHVYKYGKVVYLH